MKGSVHSTVGDLLRDWGTVQKTWGGGGRVEGAVVFNGSDQDWIIKKSRGSEEEVWLGDYVRETSDGLDMSQEETMIKDRRDGDVRRRNREVLRIK